MLENLPVTIIHTGSNGMEICFDSSSSCYQDADTVLEFSIFIMDSFGCVAYQSNNSTIKNGCIPFNMIPMSMACASSYHLEVKIHSKIIYSGPLMQIPGQANWYEF